VEKSERRNSYLLLESQKPPLLLEDLSASFPLPPASPQQGKKPMLKENQFSDKSGPKTAREVFSFESLTALKVEYGV